MASRESDTRHAPPEVAPSGRFAYDGLSRVMHEKARLGILTSLAAHADGLLFGELKHLCSLTDGNLSRHLQLLHEADLVAIWKRGEGKRSQTLVRLSAHGRQQFLEYLSVLENVVADAIDNPSATSTERRLIGDGWAPA